MYIIKFFISLFIQSFKIFARDQFACIICKIHDTAVFQVPCEIIYIYYEKKEIKKWALGKRRSHIVYVNCTTILSLLGSAKKMAFKPIQRYASYSIMF